MPGECPRNGTSGDFAGFVVFFPQLVAGPIERSYHMLPQFWRPTRLEYVRVRDGLLQAGWGLSKKVCIADLVAPFIAGVYAAPRNYNGSYLLIATVLFSIQIYCDFSGYTDMALGIAKILGYDLMANFRQPYFSTSLADFWRRWHISLSTWFRDYVYIPLGGNRVSGFRWVFNIMVVFILSGVWHGPSWTFVIWGALHGLWLMIETKLREIYCASGFRRKRRGRDSPGWGPRPPAVRRLGSDELRRARELGLLPCGERRRCVLHPRPPLRFRPRRIRSVQDFESRELRIVIGPRRDSLTGGRGLGPTVSPPTRNAPLGESESPVVPFAGLDLQRRLFRGVRTSRIHLLCVLNQTIRKSRAGSFSRPLPDAIGFAATVRTMVPEFGSAFATQRNDDTNARQPVSVEILTHLVPPWNESMRVRREMNMSRTRHFAIVVRSIARETIAQV